MTAALLMALAGIVWGICALLGRKEVDALATTSANFLRSVIFLLPLMALAASSAGITRRGLWLAICSGALTSGNGYVIWYVGQRGSWRNPVARGAPDSQVPVLRHRFLGGVLVALLGRVKAAA